MTEHERSLREYRAYLEQTEVQTRVCLGMTESKLGKERIEFKLQTILLEKGLVEAELELLYV